MAENAERPMVEGPWHASEVGLWPEDGELMNLPEPDPARFSWFWVSVWARGFRDVPRC